MEPHRPRLPTPRPPPYPPPGVAGAAPAPLFGTGTQQGSNSGSTTELLRQGDGLEVQGGQAPRVLKGHEDRGEDGDGGRSSPDRNMCSSGGSGLTNARLKHDPQWCYHFHNPTACSQHYINLDSQYFLCFYVPESSGDGADGGSHAGVVLSKTGTARIDLVL